MVIVESPAKAKTINKCLGPGYVVMASTGHVRDLPARSLGIDLENDFQPTYEIVAARRKIISDLEKAAKNAEFVYLATDLDREGEAIAWHLAETLNLPPEKLRRVVFNEITDSAIKAAFAEPRGLDMDKVNAQQARRVLDRIVGYQLSPLLWRKIAKGLSAGRVQSVAVRLIVEREWEIRAFVPTESWRVLAVFTSDTGSREQLSKAWNAFLAGGADPDAGRTNKERNAWLSDHGCISAQLVSVGGKPFKPTSYPEALSIAEQLGFVCEEIDEHDWEQYAKHGIKTVDLNGHTAVNGGPKFTVSDIQTRRTRTKPSAPFTTATLQQAASTALSFSTSRTMRTAQGLYEGVDIGRSEGPVGLITYMRTDSTQLSKESLTAIRGWVAKSFGDKYVPPKPNFYGKAKRAQEAHEAVRPTDVRLEPAALKGHLTPDQRKLYELIWRRAIASQMPPAEWDSTTLMINVPTTDGEVLFKATGRRLVFDGYQRVAGRASTTDVVLPPIETGTEMGPLEIDPEQQFTSPPPRYSEASLVKSLEADGIGRPSTYATIIKTIQDRGYVNQIDRRFHATDKGEIVTEKLIEHFPDIVTVKFTSYMEDELDKIEEAQLDWISVLREFYEPFKASLDKASVEMTPARAEPSPYKCPKCGLEMVYRWARTGRFLSCTGYPECKGALNVDQSGKPIQTADIDVACEKCGKEMVLRQSRHGYFLGCSSYPDCDNTIACNDKGEPLKLVTEKELERPCEDCGEGTMQVKRAGYRTFLGCSRYPKCKNTSPVPDGVRLERKKTPVEQAGFGCERCSRPMVLKSGRRGRFIACSGFPRCRNTKPIDKLDELRQLAAEGKLPIGSDQDASDATTADAGKSTATGTEGAKKAARRPATKGGKGKVDLETLGPPPPGYAWTRTGRPVVEDWPEDMLHCPQCGGEMMLKSGRFGPFYSCTGFPKCKCSVNLRGPAKKRAEQEMPAPARPKPIPTDIDCESCDAKMVIRTGRQGKFLGCSNYPKCKSTSPLPEELAATVSD